MSGESVALTPELDLPTIDQVCWSNDRTLAVFQAKDYEEEGPLGQKVLGRNLSLDDVYWWGINLKTSEITFIGEGLQSCYYGEVSGQLYFSTDELEGDENEVSNIVLGEIKSKIIFYDQAFKRTNDYFVDGIVTSLSEEDSNIMSIYTVRNKAIGSTEEVATTQRINRTTGATISKKVWDEQQQISRNGKHTTYLESKGSDNGRAEGEGDLPADLHVFDAVANREIFKQAGFASSTASTWGSDGNLYLYGPDFSTMKRPIIFTRFDVAKKELYQYIPKTADQKEANVTPGLPLEIHTNNGEIIAVDFSGTHDIYAKSTLRLKTGISDKIASLATKDQQPFSISYNNDSGVLSVTFYEETTEARAQFSDFLKAGGVDENLVELDITYELPLPPTQF
jgi:hypothetical protein